jgi:hypothetical protein
MTNSILGKELWQSYKFEITLIENDVSNVNEFQDSSMFILLDSDSLISYEERNGCYVKGSHVIDSISKDSIYSTGFLPDNSSPTIIKKQTLYYSENDLIYYQSENIVDEGRQDFAKVYFSKINTSLANQLNTKVCKTNSISSKSPGKSQYFTQKNYNAYNLLGQKVDLNKLYRINKLYRYVYR